MKFKIAFIGAGSLIFTRTLFTDIMSVPEFRDIDIAFTDISEDNLKKVTDLCQRDLEANGIATKIQSTLDRREAFQMPDISLTVSALVDWKGLKLILRYR